MFEIIVFIVLFAVMMFIGRTMSLLLIMTAISGLFWFFCKLAWWFVKAIYNGLRLVYYQIMLAVSKEQQR
jgi:hypothetical protein